MHKITECVILISLLAADGLAKARAADDAKGVVDPMERQTILLAEFDNVQRGDGSAGRIQRPVLYTIKVRGRVTRILNDAGHQGLREGEFQMEFTESSGGMHKGVSWTDFDIQAGQQYLIFSDPKPRLAAMVELPSGAYPVTDKEDAVADVDLILHSASLTLREQASTVSAAIAGAAKARSLFLARYGAALLAAGSDSDTAALAHSIENSRESAFSNMGRDTLLYGLWSHLRELDKPPDNLCHVFVTMTARYLVGATGHPDPGPFNIPDIRDPIRQNYVPWILGSERAKAVLRAAPAPALAEQVRKKALQAAADDWYSPTYLARLRQLAEILEAQ
ncbi:MAG: hypothetical protein WBL65_19945 [Bryobacteraceae bacterium]